MKKLITSILSLSLVFSLSTTIFAQDTKTTATPVLISAPVTSVADGFQITTAGDISLSVAPDIAYINVGVYTLEATSQTASKENARISNELIAKLKAAGIADKDITTQYYSIYPQYDYSSETPKITGYGVDNSFKITIRDIDKTGEILDLAIESGATSTSGVTFDVANKEPYYAKALNDAVQIAIKKGTYIANTVGVADPKIVSIHENSVYYQPSTYDANFVVSKEMASDSATTIQNNNVTVYASVSVTLSK